MEIFLSIIVYAILWMAYCDYRTTKARKNFYKFKDTFPNGWADMNTDELNKADLLLQEWSDELHNTVFNLIKRDV